MVRIFGSAAPRWARVFALGALSALLVGGTAYAQDSVSAAPPAQAAAAPSPFLFPGGAGLVLNFIKPDKTAEWEGILDKIKEGLQASDNPERKAQANAWRIYKATEQPVKDAVLYLWFLHDAPTDQEYSMVKLMTELFPKEAAEVYKQYSDAYVPPALQVFHLSLVKDFSK